MGHGVNQDELDAVEAVGALRDCPIPPVVTRVASMRA
jgi:hypothetical protein